MRLGGYQYPDCHESIMYRNAISLKYLKHNQEIPKEVIKLLKVKTADCYVNNTEYCIVRNLNEYFLKF